MKSIDEVILPSGLESAPKAEKLAFITGIARRVVDECTVVEHAFSGEKVDDMVGDGKYNYARMVCHSGSLVIEFRDGWAEGDGERVTRWKLLLPHFKAPGCTKQWCRKMVCYGGAPSRVKQGTYVFLGCKAV